MQSAICWKQYVNFNGTNSQVSSKSQTKQFFSLKLTHQLFNETIFGSVVKWLKHQTNDQHGLG